VSTIVVAVPGVVGSVVGSVVGVVVLVGVVGSVVGSVVGFPVVVSCPVLPVLAVSVLAIPSSPHAARESDRTTVAPR
jgi:hypothetical protein